MSFIIIGTNYENIHDGSQNSKFKHTKGIHRVTKRNQGGELNTTYPICGNLY